MKKRTVEDTCFSRRTALKSLVVGGLSLSGMSRVAQSAENPRRTRPQVDDRLVFAFGEREGQTITVSDVVMGGAPVTAYPLDAKTGVVRDGSRLNQILLVRLAADAFSEDTRAIAAAGVVAYSAVCTHTGCDVSEWQDAHFVCPCHSSTFDPKDRARVTGGPAKRPLAALPLRLVDGELRVAGPFSGRVGGQRQ